MENLQGQRITFYDYRTNRKQSQKFRLLATILLSMFAAILTPVVSIDVLSATITVQAILIGFSFSVMFFLVQDASDKSSDKSNEKFKQPDCNYSLEKQLDNEQINLLSKELFWNISYFNVISFLSLVVALAMMLPNIFGNVFRLFSKMNFLNIDWQPFVLAVNISAFIAQWIFFLLITESAFTFVRTVGRVSFLFEQRMGESA